MADTTSAPASVNSRLTPYLLIAANLLPLLGVLLGGWDVASIVVFFWAENLIIGAFNILKMLSYGTAKSAFFALFFAVHYGGFTAGHGLFIAELFDIDMHNRLDLEALLPGVGVFELLREAIAQFAASAPPLWFWGFIALIISHGGSMLLNYFGRNERALTTADELMSAPYKRLVILHVSIILGGLGVEALGSPLPLLVMLVVLKVALDLRAHLLEHNMGWREVFKPGTSRQSSDHG